MGLAGLALSAVGDESLRSPTVIAAATALFALALLWADRGGSGTRAEGSLSLRGAMLIGCAQALALVPGTSRSGITITAGLALGLTRTAAARFSFLLSIPVIVLAGGLKTVEAVSAQGPVPWLALAGGAVISAVAAYLTIDWFLRLVDRVGMMPFVVYRLALAVVIWALVV